MKYEYKVEAPDCWLVVLFNREDAGGWELVCQLLNGDFVFRREIGTWG